jgi:hypothetical protein
MLANSAPQQRAESALLATSARSQSHGFAPLRCAHHPEEPSLRYGTSGLHDGGLSGLKEGLRY